MNVCSEFALMSVGSEFALHVYSEFAIINV